MMHACVVPITCELANNILRIYQKFVGEYGTIKCFELLHNKFPIVQTDRHDDTGDQFRRIKPGIGKKYHLFFGKKQITSLQKILSTFGLVLLDFLKSWTARVQLV